MVKIRRNCVGLKKGMTRRDTTNEFISPYDPAVAATVNGAYGE